MIVNKAKVRVRNFFQKHKLLNAIYSLVSRSKNIILKPMSDSAFARLCYKHNAGKILNLKAPIYFNEKLWWLKIYNRDPFLTICSDKVKVREYVKDCGLEDILTKCYGVYDSPYDVEFKKFSTKVVVKCNHVSGTNIFYSPGSVLPNWYFRKFSSALKSNYYLASREWNYKNIRPKILVEEFLESSDPLMDYRFLCFDGIVKVVFIDKDTAQDSGLHNPDAVRNVYDPEFNRLPVKVGRDNYDAKDLIKPKNWSDMIAIAETLSKRFPFCRVDLYNIDGRIVFGEMTFYPGGCCQNVEPQEWDFRLGSYIDLSSKNIVC